ncbi:UDP-N-acetylmuramoyl-L-alanine--D-glutamate ligase [Helicobacter sp. WB40]|uniref:UDP-N-acetylmuramoyl-L-alanine--D-glutamate ligase n=1 Tax=Helicobacter sp. WB40 TaxID=3004130 RepID=UPI0022EBFFBA|nr:UDP-N-acetylmuramoyl-L-alanine--D-glutamate ligase [Helicobacter sp. WB40]MDA3967122.1 UDP-N-acetylmuramoyl-L-alanine--D-glutamate ligase [Helicobacter sp. WB40]
MIVLLGFGGTTQAIAKQFAPCAIFDDKFLYKQTDELGNILMPTNMLVSFLSENKNIQVITSPGIPPQNQMIQDTIKILGKNNLLSEYDFFAKDMPPSIWISGTNGKTTTTQMLHHLLSHRGIECGGNIGTPLANLSKNAPMWILETSSFTLHYTNIARPNLYILLPLSEDHISWHGDYESYVDSKLKVLLHMREKEIAIIPKNLQNHKYCKESLACLIFYENSTDLAESFYINLQDIPFKEPFLLDSILALCASKALFSEANYKLLSEFKIGQHKIEEFFDNKNRLWVDDSKGTNVDATIQALKRYKDKEILLILGGDDKGANLDYLFAELKMLNVKIYAIGSNAEKLKLLSDESSITCTMCKELKIAIKEINKIHSTTSVALLSPAAASLDQFSSYKQRGELFKKYALEIT